MLIKQVIEFESRGPEPRGRSSTPTSVFFIFFFIKLKFLRKFNLGMDYYLLLKHSRWQCILLSPFWAKSFTKKF